MEFGSSTSASPSSGSRSSPSSSDTRPTAAPPSQQSRNRKRDREPPRTKGTCDRCALSKVKCDRQQPYCARCVAIGRDLGIDPPCHYTVSLRSLKRKNGPKGRERSGTESSTATPPTPELRPLEGLITPSPFPADQDGGSEVGSEYAGTPPQMEQVLPIPIRRQTSDTLYPFGPTRCSITAPSSTTPPTSMGWPNPLERTSSRCTTASMSRFHNGTDGARQDCLDLIHSCTHDMVRTRNSDPLSGLSLDQVLSINGRTINAFQAIMECPCTEASDSAFSLACLLHTTFLFFRNAVDSLLPLESLRAGPPYHTIEPHPRLQVLRSELEKISIVADEFTSRFCDRGKQNDVMQFQMLKYSLNMELKQCLDALDERAGCRS